VKSDPVIIECAVNGATSRSRNANVPITPDEITSVALACMSAGAAIIHQHDDVLSSPQHSVDEMAARALEAYRPILATRPDAIMYPTTNFGDGPINERWGHHELLAAADTIRMGLLDPGSLSLGAPDADGIPRGSFVYAHSYDDIRTKADGCRRLRLGPSIAIFEPGFLQVVLAYHRAGQLPQGAFVKLYFSEGRLLFGHRPSSKALDLYLEMLDGTGLPWAVAVLGGDVIASGLAAEAVARGGHLRVGLEDFAGPGAPSNVELVEAAAAVVKAAGRSIATCDEAAALLDLPRR
jgi:3-keto-5-aminohexanoate cleavage enzyme